MIRLLILGLGYAGAAVKELAMENGAVVVGTTRAGTPGSIAFDQAGIEFATATHILACAPPYPLPGPDADPILARYASAIAAAPALRWIGYLSSTVVYGNRDGGWVDEDTPPRPTQDRGVRRVAAEQAWAKLADRFFVAIFRIGGIYGPNRSALDDLRAGRGRRIIKAEHQFGRIHRDDIARAVWAAMQLDSSVGCRHYNLVDDEPAESAKVIEEAASLLGLPPPPAVLFEDALAAMTPMAQSFWAENRKVSAAKTKAALCLSWRYPTYREGLRGILNALARPLARP